MILITGSVICFLSMNYMRLCRHWSINIGKSKGVLEHYLDSITLIKIIIIIIKNNKVNKNLLQRAASLNLPLSSYCTNPPIIYKETNWWKNNNTKISQWKTVKNKTKVKGHKWFMNEMAWKYNASFVNLQNADLHWNGFSFNFSQSCKPCLNINKQGMLILNKNIETLIEKHFQNT